MIAKVRIAPMERWCERALKSLQENPALAELVGLEIEILPRSMFVGNGERHWLYGPNKGNRLWEIVRGNGTCEHVLEMD